MEPLVGACLDDDVVMAMLDGAVAPEDLEGIHQHLDACDACRRLVADLARCIRPEDEVVSTRSLRPGTEIGRYVVTQWLGMGSVGVVYEARDTLLERRVALKLLRPDAAEVHDGRLLREAKALAALSHPHVLAVHDAGVFDGGVFIAIELVDGPTLREWARDEERTWRAVLAKLVEAGRGLAAAHQAGLVHRDFKPDNALVTTQGRLVVTDFGLVRGSEALTEDAEASVADEHPVSPRTEAGALIGTPAYMAPEQLGGAAATSASDQFALCVSAYELLVGQLPFAGSTVGARRVAILGGELQGRAEAQRRLPRPVLRVLERGLAADPAARYPSMAALGDALERTLARDRERPARRWRWVGLVATGAALAGVGYKLAARAPQPTSGCATGAEFDWGIRQRQALTQAMSAGGSSFAADAAQRAVSNLDRYAEAWTEAYTSTCAALTDAEPLDAEALHLRLACLHSRRREFVALATVLAEPDPRAPQHAVRATGELSPVASCAEATSLQRRASQVSPFPREVAEAFEDRLARATALRDAGLYAEARDAASALLADVVDAPPSSIRVQVQILESDALTRLNEADQGYAGYLQALEWAEELEDTHARVRALRGLAFTAGALEDDFERGIQWARLAKAAADRTGVPRLRAEVLSATSAVHRTREDREQALEYSQQAVALWEGIDHPNRVVSLYNAGTDLRSLRRFEEAEAVLVEARQEGERMLGPAHPVVGAIVGSLGTLHAQRGEPEAALPLLRESLRIREDALGEDNPSLGPTLLGVANAEHNAGRPALARPVYERCTSIVRSPVMRGYCNYGLGKALRKLGEPEASAKALAEAYDAVASKVTGPVLAEIAFAYAESLGSDERARARVLAERALQLYREAGSAHGVERERVEDWLEKHLGLD